MQASAAVSWPGPADRLPPGVEVHLFRIDDDSAMPVDVGWSLLSALERARAERFHFDRDRLRFIRGRAFLRHVLGKHLGRRPEGIVIDTGAWQKPFVAGAPDFNLSHSGGHAVLALAQGGSIGIDIECIDRHCAIEAVAQRCCVADELEALHNSPSASRRKHFFAFWTAKEALMKMTGQGMSLAPHTIALDLKDAWPRGYRRPAFPGTELHHVHTGHPDLICCLAWRPAP